ncbi:MAG: YcxB family protein, partial [Chthoniobacterales bacterium]
STTDHTIRVSIDDEGIAVKCAAGNSTLPWSIVGRIWAGKEVVLVFYHGWHYIAFPTAAVPAKAIDFISTKVKSRSWQAAL